MNIKIKIFSPQFSANLTIDSIEEKAELNGIEIFMDFTYEIENLIEIFSSWENKEDEFYILDDESVSVEVCENNITKKMSYTGNFPENYKEFKKVIKEIIKCF